MKPLKSILILACICSSVGTAMADRYVCDMSIYSMHAGDVDYSDRLSFTPNNGTVHLNISGQMLQLGDYGETLNLSSNGRYLEASKINAYTGAPVEDIVVDTESNQSNGISVLMKGYPESTAILLDNCNKKDK